MNFLRSRNFKRTSASIFMSLFIFVHAVKTFHTHEYSFSTQASKNPKQTNIASNFYCAICDFQLAKDSDAAIASIYFSSPLKNITTYYSFKVENVITTTKEVASRGPPVLA